MAAPALERSVNLHETLQVERLVNHFPLLAEELGDRAVYLVRADTEISGSFKWRGAANAIAALSEDTKKVVTASAGNHAGGVVVAAAMRGLDATVVVPKTAPPEKVHKLYELWQDRNGWPNKLEVTSYGDNFDEALEYSKFRYPDLPFIHPFGDPKVIEGQGSLMHDVRRALPGATDAVMPVGGGGLVVGVHAAAEGEVKVWGVEANGSNSLSRSLLSGSFEPVEATNPNKRYGGSSVRKTDEHVLRAAYESGFWHDQLITADDREVFELAMYYKREGEQPGKQLEPTSLVAVAGLMKLFRSGRFGNDNVVAVIGTGHNESPLNLTRQQQNKALGGFIGSN